MPIRELLTSHKIRFTRAELSIVRELLANYPAAGLSTIAKLARQARVSDPTVLRLVTKLGFDGFPRFQRELLREIEERMSSPLAMLPSRQTVLRKKDLYNSFLKSCVAGLAAAENLLVPADLEAALDLMMDPRSRIRFLGGRFSRFLAGIMHAHFVQLRPGTQFVSGTASDLVDGIVDLGPRDVIVAFDFRRYQVDVINYCRQAAARGARVVLFTDPWKSPITEFASVTLMSPVETISPYDTMVPAAALVEALIAALVARLTPAGRKRIKLIEESRRDFGVTTDVAAERRPPARRGGRHRRNGGGA